MKKPSISDRAIACAGPGVRAANPHIWPDKPVLFQVTVKEKKPRSKTRTEAEFEAILRRENPGATILFERYTLKLGNDLRYVPDFAVIDATGISFWEVKGAYLFRGATKSATHTSLTKPKLAAELFPWHRFYRATKGKDGQWTRELYRAL